MTSGYLIPWSGDSDTSTYPESHGFSPRSTISFIEDAFYIILSSAPISSK